MMDTGLGFVQPMFFIGVVEDRNDPRLEGRVRVRAFGVHGSNRDIPTDDLPWATLILGHHDVNFTIPPLNAWVFGFFIDGRDAQQPMILGLIPAQTVDVVDPAGHGWGAQPAENYDLQMQGARARDLGTSPMPNLATGEFLNETYNAALELNRAREIPIAGGGARGYTPGGNSPGWVDDRGEGQDVQPAPGRPGRVARDVQEGIDNLDNDSAFQSELSRITQRYGVSREQVYGIIVGEGAIRNPSLINNFGYAGLFQFGQAALTDINRRQGTNYTPQSIARLPPAEQLRVYGYYLDRWNFRNTSGLGIIQAAPGFARRPGSTEVYAVGTTAWQRNPGWRGPDGRITVDSINAYYNTRNPPPLAATTPEPTGAPPLLEDPRETDRVEQSRLNEQRQARQQEAERLREELAQVEQNIVNLERAGLAEFASELNALRRRKAELERQIAELDPNGSTNDQSGEPYRGYMADSTSPESVTTWSEPASAYAAQYPFNRVIETAAGHSIELDDTPGGERIMIWHRDGSYIQISSTATTHKNMGDAYNIHERNHHVYIKGTNIVTIDGDSHVLVKGNKVEEIQGDYRQIVHGSIQMGAARSVEINGATRTDIRSAALALDSNVENLNIRTAQNIAFESGDSISFRSKTISLSASQNASITGQGVFVESEQNMHLKANGNMYVNPDQNLFLRANGGTISMQSNGSIRMNSGTFTSIKSGSTMDLQAEANLIIKSDATINMNSDGSISLKSTEMFLDSGGGKMNMTGQDVAIEAAGAVDIKGSGGPVSLEADGAMNLLSGVQMRITGSDVYIRGGTTYIDDIVQLASGANNPAAPADSADVKEAIDPAPYESEFGEGDVSPEADASPEAPLAGTPQTAAEGPAAPPTPSLAEGELDGSSNPETDFSPTETTTDLGETTPPVDPNTDSLDNFQTERLDQLRDSGVDGGVIERATVEMNRLREEGVQAYPIVLRDGSVYLVTNPLTETVNGQVVPRILTAAQAANEARRLGMEIPSRDLIPDIQRSANTRHVFRGQGLGPGGAALGTPQEIINARAFYQRRGFRFDGSTGLVFGAGKVYAVDSNGRVGIIRPGLQPFYTGHSQEYSDYSHTTQLGRRVR
jgi:hypothetical protein